MSTYGPPLEFEGNYSIFSRYMRNNFLHFLLIYSIPYTAYEFITESLLIKHFDVVKLIKRVSRNISMIGLGYSIFWSTLEFNKQMRKKEYTLSRMSSVNKEINLN